MGNQNRTKMYNTSRILREIWLAKEISRVDISNRLKLNKSTVTNIVRDLISDNIILLSEEGEPGPKGGRKPVMLTLNRRFGYVLGFEFRPEAYTVVAVDLEGEVLFYKSEKISISQENFTTKFLEIMKRVEDEQQRLGLPLLGIGVGLSGIVDPDSCRIISSIPLRFSEPFDFHQEISKHFDVPFFIDNDANCCAWGELAFHRVRNFSNFIFVLVEFRDYSENERIHDTISVGLGVVINGKVHYGDGNYAGEFRSIFSEKGHKGQFSLNAEEVQDLSRDNKVLKRFFVELSKNLAILANIFNLSQIFLGGDVEKYRTQIVGILQEEIESNWPYSFSVDREILFSSLGDKSVAFGAAGMVLNRLLVDFDQESNPQNRFLTGSAVELVTS